MALKHKLKSEEKITDELDKLFSSCEKFGDNIKDYMQNHGSNDNEGEQNDSEDARDESEDEKDHNKENLFSKNEIYKLLLGEYINVEDTKFKEKIFKNRLNNLFKCQLKLQQKKIERKKYAV
ncbi:hypothetical protein [Wolbachia endosymbiont of Chironomus riparius]|uniref:hypothetical protein n=1 Tax=Wolbachia endosymbiont of Chironomus riparius TaxID=2883238 RepID=UPI00209E3779|nr:hypothetical protein [Wolbachia endosymbiont of Chironomus riparius]